MKRLLIAMSLSFATLAGAATCPVDPTFGVDGVARFPVENTRHAQTDALLVDGAGRALLVGSAQATDESSFLFAQRVRRDGSLDTTFGDAGIAVKPISPIPDGRLWIRDAILDAQGRIVVLAWSDAATFVMRFAADGRWDDQFGNAGRIDVHCDPGGFGSDDGWTLAIDPASRILVRGTSYAAGYSWGILVRLTAEGDRDFCAPFVTGWTVLPRDTGYDLVGPAEMSSATLSVMRLNDDGSRDVTFGASGTRLTALPAGFSFTRVATAGDSLVVSLESVDRTPAAAALVRVLADGMLDESYGDGGLRLFEFNPLPKTLAMPGLDIAPGGRAAVSGTASGQTAFAIAESDGAIPPSCEASTYDFGLGTTPRSYG